MPVQGAVWSPGDEQDRFISLFGFQPEIKVALTPSTSGPVNASGSAPFKIWRSSVSASNDK
jgi:hypothetical protein